MRNDQLARWLAAHPEYGQTNAAQVSGKNPDQYLRNWTDNQPPAGKEGEPAEHVTPELAMRYCASVGGRLPMIDAEPQTWNDKEAPFEYRINAQGLVTLLESSGRRLGKPAPKRTATFVRIVCVQ